MTDALINAEHAHEDSCYSALCEAIRLLTSIIILFDSIRSAFAIEHHSRCVENVGHIEILAPIISTIIIRLIYKYPYWYIVPQYW